MTSKVKRIRDWFRRLPPRQADLVLASIALADALIEIAGTGAPQRDMRIGLALAPLAAVAVLLHRRMPIAAVAVGLTLIVALGLLDERVTEGVGGPYVLGLLLVFSMALRCEGRRLWAGAAVATALGQLGVWTDNHGANGVDAVMMMALLVAGPVAAGRLTRSRIELNRALREKAAVAHAERARAADEAVAEERERIAGELHDVIAHALGAMTVQASAARRLARSDPQRSHDAFRAVEDTGREALGELRRLLGVLRREDEELALAPQPRLAFLRDLVRRARAAGLPTDLDVQGDAPAIFSAGVDVTGYRIVQEALRAALEDGGAGHAQVRVRFARDEIMIEVADDGPGEPPRRMLGMEERVRVYGGQLSTGPSDRGHRLRARLPLEARG